MDVLIVALLGVILVLALVLVLKLHPLLSLLLASLFVLLATPYDLQLKSHLQEVAIQVLAEKEDVFRLDQAVESGDFRVVTQDLAVDDWPRVSLKATPELQGKDPGSEQVLVTSGGNPSATLSSGQSLVRETDVQGYSRLHGLGARLAFGFNRTFRKLGIPVTMAAIVGACLLKSGAAFRLVMAIAALFGSKGTAPALTASGFVLGIPVFFDNVFYLLLPLAKAAGKKQPAKFLTLVMAIIVGATMAHSLVPPTPGPLIVCDELGVSVGLMMCGGFVVGSVAAACGFGYGVWCNRWIQLSPDNVSTRDQEPTNETEPASSSAATMPLFVAALPLAIPLLLLGGSEVIEFLYSNSSGWERSSMAAWTKTLNDPSLIFIGAALAAAAVLLRYSDRETLRATVAKGLADAGVIVLLTCAGGAFGASLQQLDLAGTIGRWAEGSGAGSASAYGLLVTAFALTAIIRGAQGSATVAMVTSAAILSPVLASVELPFHPLYLALAIGCGSKPLPWMNDSGFWQVSTMTGMTPQQTLKTFSIALTIMGTVGFLVTLLGAWLIPLTTSS